MTESGSLGELITRTASERQGLLASGGGGRVVPGHLLHHAEMVQGVGLPGLVAEITVDRGGLGEAGSR